MRKASDSANFEPWRRSFKRTVFVKVSRCAWKMRSCSKLVNRLARSWARRECFARVGIDMARGASSGTAT